MNTIHHRDALEGLRSLPDHSVDCAVTSPPYWGLRDYGVSPTRWADGIQCQLGQETTCTQYIAHLAEVAEEIRRVLKRRGTLWINIGDTYGRTARGSPPQVNRRAPHGRAPPVRTKSLSLVPERLAIALCDAGWTLRNRIAWHKTNALPHPVTDRFTTAWEHLYFFSQSRHYHFDLDAVREPHSEKSLARTRGRWNGQRKPGTAWRDIDVTRMCHPRGRNPRDHWSIPHDSWSLPTNNLPTPHPSVFPERLCERPILAGCPEGGLVLDPFMGTGTVAVVALRHGRNYLGYELNDEFLRVAAERLRRERASRGE